MASSTQPSATTNVDRPAVSAAWPAWPLVDDDEVSAASSVLLSGEWGGVDAPAVREFEEAFARSCGASHAASISNGTISLEIALRALGVGHGDEVIVPPYTFLATATAVLGVNALPVFADIDPDTYCLDPRAVDAAVGPRTRAVIVVHLGGHPADLDALQEVCTRRGLALIEDAAHAHGARWSGQHVGTFGAFGSWSFQGSKNLTCGEGGMLTTEDAALHEAALVLRNCGRRPGGAWYLHEELGGNHRLTAVQAALGVVGLRRLPVQVARREASAAVLDEQLGQVDGITPLARDPRTDVHAHHLYLFRHDPRSFGGMTRAELVSGLQEHGIPASAGYPIPLYRQPLFAQRRFDARATGWLPDNPATRYDTVSCPVSERACAETVWLPHNLLLADPDRMLEVVSAIRSLQSKQRR